jgi:hypothetical protein
VAAEAGAGAGPGNPGRLAGDVPEQAGALGLDARVPALTAVATGPASASGSRGAVEPKVSKLKASKLKVGKLKVGKSKAGSSAGGPGVGGPVGGKRRGAVSKLGGPVVRAARRRVRLSSWRRMSARRWPSPTRIRRRAAS